VDSFFSQIQNRDTKSPDSTTDMVTANPLAARELPKAIILPRQDNLFDNLTAFRRSFIWWPAPFPAVNPLSWVGDS